MSNFETKQLIIEVKELSFEKDQHVTDLLRFLTEQLPQIEISRNGNEIEVNMPEKLSRRALKLRIKKFLYQKGLNDKFRPISYKKLDSDGYMVKRKKIVELTYY
ncbi:MAG: 60S ribosomal protein L22 [Candidatus Hodarchaeota archaeon]